MQNTFKNLKKTSIKLSILISGKAKALGFSTLKAICKAIDCQPEDLLTFTNDKKKTQEWF